MCILPQNDRIALNMLQKTVTFTTNQETIAGTILYKDENSIDPNFIFFHGGAGNKERIYSVIPPVVDSGKSVLAIDFSGHGASTGELKKSSLKKRVEEATAAIDNYIETNDSLIICGASMGGYIAIKMLELYKVKSLILFCPALYDKNAYNVLFDEGFTDIIRTPQSWRNTDALRLLEDFTGNLLNYWR